MWDNEKDALGCEAKHIDFKKLKITWVKYNDYDTINDIDNRKKKLQAFIPQTIKVEFRDKENANQFGCKSFVAYYELKRWDWTYDKDERHNLK